MTDKYKALIFKFRYALRMREVVRISFFEGWSIASECLKSSPESIDECPVECADIELSYWED